MRRTLCGILSKNTQRSKIEDRSSNDDPRSPKPSVERLSESDSEASVADCQLPVAMTLFIKIGGAPIWQRPLNGKEIGLT